MELIDIKGIGPKKKEKLNKLGIFTVSDLCNYYPRLYEDRSKRMDIENANPDKYYYFKFKIISLPVTRYVNNKTITSLYVTDGKKKARVIWFNNKFVASKLVLNRVYKFYTKLNRDSIRTCFNPVIAPLDDDKIGGIVPIYSLTNGLSDNDLHKFIRNALKVYDYDTKIIPDNLRHKFKITTREDQLKEIHFPTVLDNLLKAKSDLKVEDFVRELFFLKLIKDKNTIESTRKIDDLYYNDILESLDFTLTNAQLNVLSEIIYDLKDTKVMNRLLCGDVGSGKTIVAIISMMVVARNKFQSALMVPTEILALQHYENSKKLIESFGYRVCLLVGSLSLKKKEQVKEKIKSGYYDIVIGTQAIIQKDVEFNNLLYVVSDEQHRFGVEQRKNLSDKGENVNYLTMTATPIPRTMMLRLNKILDLSIIDTLPKNRKAVITDIINEENESSIISAIRKEIDRNGQVYIVTSSIDNKEDKNNLLNLTNKFKKIFNNLNVSSIHGKKSAEDKEKILEAFQNKDIDILISTTIIEVGIDVKNANTIVIYNANNFGLSQLHQLRGRVGRSDREAYCYLIQNNNSNSKLNILKKTNNGFEIAKFDLEYRGGGNVFSTMQHGKNLDYLSYMNLNKDEIELSFEIYDYIINNKKSIENYDIIEKYYEENGKIVLN